MSERKPAKKATKDLLTIAEVAEMLTVSAKTVRQMIDLAIIQPINLAPNAASSRAVWRIKRTDVENLIRERQKKPPTNIRAA